MGVRRKLIGIVGALVFALAGTFLVLNARGGSGDKAVTREQVPMLVATQNLKAGTSVDKLIKEPGMVAVAMVNIEEKNVDALVAFEDLSAYEGKVLNADIAANGAVLTSSFVDRGALSLAAGGVEVPPELLQISFSLEPQRVLGGALRPGDRVAVVSSFAVSNPGAAEGASAEQTHIVLQKALVANVQLSNLANANDAATAADGAPAVVGNYTVTLALSAPDTERLAFALEWGQLWLAKQPETAGTEGTKIWDVNQHLNDPVTNYAAPTP